MERMGGATADGIAFTYSCVSASGKFLRYNDANASISDALASKASAEAEIASAAVELARIETRLARQATQFVPAPSNGTVLRITARQGGDIVKGGDVLAHFVPDTDDQAVELWIDGNDVNLIQPGAPARTEARWRRRLA